MIILETVLIVFAREKGFDNVNVLLVEDRDKKYSLPTLVLEDDSRPLLDAAYLLKKYTNLQAIVNNIGWIPLLQKRLIDNIERKRNGNRYIAIPFATYLPESTALPPDKPVKWVRIKDMREYPKMFCLVDDHREIITKAMSEI